MEDKFDQLSEQHKNEALNFMQITGTDDVNIAINYLEMASYDTANAVNLYFQFQERGGRDSLPSQQQQQQGPNSQNQQQQQQRNNGNSNNGNRQQQRELTPLQQAVTEYRRFLVAKAAREQDQGMVSMFKKGFNSILSGLRFAYNKVTPVLIRGETPGGEEFIYMLQRQYGKNINTFDFQEGLFSENLEKAHYKKVPLLVYVHIDGNQANSQLIFDILTNPAIKAFVNKNFHVLGLNGRTDEAKNIQNFIPSQNFPCLACFRLTLHEKPALQSFINVTSENSSSDFYLQGIKAMKDQFYMLMSEDDKVVSANKTQLEQRIQQRNQFFAENLFNLMDQAGFEPQQRQQRSASEIAAQQAQIEEDRILRQTQEEAFRQAERLAEQKQQQKKIEEQKKKEEEEQAAILETQKQADLDKKRALLPQEPEKSNPDAFTFAFRVPDGSRIMRRFLKTHSIQVLFDFIECKDEINFESKERKFDLVQTFPPLSLLSRISETVNAVFPDSVQEILIVKEL